VSDVKYFRVKGLAKTGRHPFSEKQLRRLLYDRENNGLSKCCRKVGEMVLIREDLFLDWIENQTDTKKDQKGELE